MLLDQSHKAIILTLVDRVKKYSDMEALCLQGWGERWQRDDYEMNEQELCILYNAVLKRKGLFSHEQIMTAVRWVEAHPEFDANGAKIEVQA